MKLGNYTLEIIGGTESAQGYVALVHGQRYLVRMRNDGNRKCDAKLEIDGNEMGVFRLDPGRQIEIERPTHTDGCFTFFELATPEAHAAGLKSMPQTGLVRVTYMPERQQSASLASPPAAPRHAPLPNPNSSGSSPNSGSAGLSKPADPPAGGADRTWLGTAPGLPPAAESPTREMALFSPAPSRQPPSASDSPGLAAGGSGLSGRSRQTFSTSEPIRYAPAHEFVTITLRLGGAMAQGIRPLVPEPLANPVPPPLT